MSYSEELKEFRMRAFLFDKEIMEKSIDPKEQKIHLNMLLRKWGLLEEKKNVQKNKEKQSNNLPSRKRSHHN